jgi:hypothetical protein
LSYQVIKICLDLVLFQPKRLDQSRGPKNYLTVPICCVFYLGRNQAAGRIRRPPHLPAGDGVAAWGRPGRALRGCSCHTRQLSYWLLTLLDYLNRAHRAHHSQARMCQCALTCLYTVPYIPISLDQENGTDSRNRIPT